jgi:hypothetical protein
MPSSPSIGSLTPFCVNGPTSSAPAITAPFYQSGADGTGIVIGAKRQKTVKLKSTHYHANQPLAEATKVTAAAMVGTTVAISRFGESAVAGCVIMDVTVLTDKATIGGPSPWLLELSWDVLYPASY